MVKKEKHKPNKSVDEDQKVKRNIQKIKHKIVVMSGKGGVGKSTIATNLAFALSMHGAEVGLLDVDINGPDIAKMLGIEDERLGSIDGAIAPVIVPPHLKVISMAFLLQDRDTPVIWRGPLKMQAIQQFLGDVSWGELDYLVIDFLLDSRKAVNFAKTLMMPIIGILENMSGLVCPHCKKTINLFKTGGGFKAALDLSVPFLGKIPIDPKIVETGDNGKPFILTYSKSKSAKEFNEVLKKIEDFVNNKKR